MPISGLAQAPGPSLTHEWVGTSPRNLLGTGSAHQPMPAAMGHLGPFNQLPWDPAPSPALALGPDCPLADDTTSRKPRPCSQPPCDPALPTSTRAPWSVHPAMSGCSPTYQCLAASIPGKARQAIRSGTNHLYHHPYTV